MNNRSCLVFFASAVWTQAMVRICYNYCIFIVLSGLFDRDNTHKNT